MCAGFVATLLEMEQKTHWIIASVAATSQYWVCLPWAQAKRQEVEALP